MNATSFKQRSFWQSILLIAGILLIALNLRPALASVGPIIDSIRQATGLSNALLGLLTTLPLLAFGFISILTPKFTKKFGIELTLAIALGLIATGVLLRVVPIYIALFGGTLILGIGIAFGNVLLPVLIKRDFPEHSGTMTGIYSATLAIGATVASGISVPLAQKFGWRWSLAAWALLVSVAFIVWFPQLSHKTRPKHKRKLIPSLIHLGKNKLAWQVALYMGLQSFTFYVMLAWLPDILQSRGLTATYAGWMLSLSQGAGIFGNLFLPIIGGKLDRHRTPVLVLIVLEAISIVGLLLPSTQFVGLWVALLGFGLGGSFSLSLLFIILRTSNSESATELSGMAQSIGYLLAATGPVIFGLLHDITHAWFLPLVILLVVMMLKLMAGLGASRPLMVD